MKRLLPSSLLLLFLTHPLSAGDVVLKPDAVPVKQNTFCVLTVEVAKGDQVAFTVYPNPPKREANGNKLYLSGVPGTKYTVSVTVVNFGKDGNKERFDTGQVEIPFEGDGGVDPLPPTPPAPDMETATLLSKLQAAFKEESDFEKPLAAELRKVYSAYASDAELLKYKTWGELNAAMGKTAEGLGFGGTPVKLLKTQTAISEWMVGRYPGRNAGWENVIITDADRKGVKATFTSIATALGRLK